MKTNHNNIEKPKIVNLKLIPPSLLYMLGFPLCFGEMYMYLYTKFNIDVNIFTHFFLFFSFVLFCLFVGLAFSMVIAVCKETFREFKGHSKL